MHKFGILGRRKCLVSKWVLNSGIQLYNYKTYIHIIYIQEISRNPSDLEERERMLDIIAGVGARGFLLTEPDCNLILEGVCGGGGG